MMHTQQLEESVVPNTLPPLLLLTGVAAAAGVAADGWLAAALRPSEPHSPGLSHTVQAPPEVRAPGAPSEAVLAQQASADPVVQRDIFGAARHPTSATPTGSAPSTSSFVLATTVVDPEGGFAVAWLGQDGERPQACAVGDRFGGWDVVEITPRTVVLRSHDGAEIEVAMQGSSSGSREHSASQTRGAGSASSGRTRRPSGYRLSGLAAGDPLFDQGLRDGDVLHTVAGVAVASDQAAHLALETARLVGPVDVDLTRDGQRSTLSLLLP